jgi:pimeloyl-ACP methyl ester carboxylesterase
MVCAHRYGPQNQQPAQLYQQLHTNAKLIMLEKAEWQYGPVELEKLEVFLTRTDRGHQIACLFVRCTPTPKYTILFSHGNAVDLGQMSSFYYGLGCRLECNVFTYDYSGYGASNGSPTEKNLYSDIQAAWNALRIRYGISPSNIILYGQSIGINIRFFLFSIIISTHLK